MGNHSGKCQSPGSPVQQPRHRVGFLGPEVAGAATRRRVAAPATTEHSRIKREKDEVLAKGFVRFRGRGVKISACLKILPQNSQNDDFCRFHYECSSNFAKSFSRRPTPRRHTSTSYPTRIPSPRRHRPHTARRTLFRVRPPLEGICFSDLRL